MLNAIEVERYRRPKLTPIASQVLSSCEVWYIYTTPIAISANRFRGEGRLSVENSNVPRANVHKARECNDLEVDGID